MLKIIRLGPPARLSRLIQLNRPTTSIVGPQRHFSVQSSVQSLAATQAGLFKTLSESTPVEYCQDFLLQVHESTGLPWWASIVLSTVILRSVVTLPFAVYQQIIIARLENLKLELPAIAEELRHETSMAVRMYKWDERMAQAVFRRSMKTQWDNLVVRDNCHPLKTTVLLWFQIPLWVCVSVSIRNLVYMLPVPDMNASVIFSELSMGGLSFIPNLTVPDQSWIFPVTLGILNLAIIELQLLSRSPTSETGRMQKVLTNIFRAVSLVMIPIGASVPSCLVLYWTTSSAYGLLQNFVLLSPKIKRLLQIPKTEIEVQEPYKLIAANFKSKFKLA